MADISKIKLPDGNTYDIKDAVARTQGGGTKAVNLMQINFVGTMSGYTFTWTSATFNGSTYTTRSALRTALNDYKTANGFSAFNLYVTFNGDTVTSTQNYVRIKDSSTTYYWQMTNTNATSGITETYNTATNIGTSNVTFTALEPQQINVLKFSNSDFTFNGDILQTKSGQDIYAGTLTNSSGVLSASIPSLLSTNISGRTVMLHYVGADTITFSTSTALDITTTFKGGDSLTLKLSPSYQPSGSNGNNIKFVTGPCDILIFINTATGLCYVLDVLGEGKYTPNRYYPYTTGGCKLMNGSTEISKSSSYDRYRYGNLKIYPLAVRTATTAGTSLKIRIGTSHDNNSTNMVPLVVKRREGLVIGKVGDIVTVDTTTPYVEYSVTILGDLAANDELEISFIELV